MKKVMKKQGFTLVEIMIVVAIIGLLAAIGIPSFAKARENARENSCINNLRVIDAGMQQMMITDNLSDNAAIDQTELATYCKGGVLPACPIDQTAYANTAAAGVSPTCANNAADTHEVNGQF